MHDPSPAPTSHPVHRPTEPYYDAHVVPTAHAYADAPIAHAYAHAPVAHAYADSPVAYAYADAPVAHAYADAPVAHAYAATPTFEAAVPAYSAPVVQHHVERAYDSGYYPGYEQPYGYDAHGYHHIGDYYDDNKAKLGLSIQTSLEFP